MELAKNHIHRPFLYLSAGLLILISYTSLTSMHIPAEDNITLYLMVSDAVLTIPTTLLTILFWVITAYKFKKPKLLWGIPLMLFFYVSATYLNELFLKEQIASPRPNMVWMMEHHYLNMEEFYEQHPTKILRRQALEPVVNQIDSNIVPLALKSHWIHETGYSFPSGHSEHAWILCSSLIFLLSYFYKRVMLFNLLLVALAVAVSLSRVLLYVHRPIDVIVGALMGVVLGYVLFLILQAIFPHEHRKA